MLIPLLCCISDFIFFALCDEWLAHCVMMYAIAYYSIQEHESISSITFLFLMFWILLQDLTVYGTWGARLVYLIPLYLLSRSLKTTFLVSKTTLCLCISVLFLAAHYTLEWYLKGGVIIVGRSTLLAIIGNISLLLWFVRRNTLLGMLGNRFNKN